MPPLPADVFFDTASGLNARWVKREFTARELAAAFCDRLEKLGPRYNALALLLRGPALRKAALADAELKRERIRGPAARRSLRRQGSAERGRFSHHLGRPALPRPGFRRKTPPSSVSWPAPAPCYAPS